IAGVRRLLGDDQSVRLTVLKNGGAEEGASSDEAGWQLDEPTAEWLSRTHAFSLRADYDEVPAAVRADLRLFAGDTVLVVPLSMRSEVRAMLVVCSPTSVQPALFDSLEALGAQISLALEGASLAEDLHRRQSEARFRSLVAHSSDLITVLDADGVVTYQSPSVRRGRGGRRHLPEPVGRAGAGLPRRRGREHALRPPRRRHRPAAPRAGRRARRRG